VPAHICHLEGCRVILKHYPYYKTNVPVKHHENADRGALVTTGTFSRQAQSWAKGKPLILINGEEFLRLGKKKSARAV
jgi:hypothetical protein